MSASSKKIIFTGTQGDPLFANLELPDGKAKTYALFAHCFTCSKDSLAAVRISRALMAQGIGVLRFDFTGLGSSAGDFANTNFSSNVDDLLRAAAFLQENGYAPRFLIGHSFGGAAVLAAASRLPDVKAVITIGAPAEPKHITHLLKEKMEDIQSKGEAEVKLAGRTFRIQKQFLQDLDNHRLLGGGMDV